MTKIIYFYKKDCPLLAYQRRQISEANLENIEVIEIDAELNPFLLVEYGVERWHTIVFVDDNGTLLHKIDGPFSSHDLEEAHKNLSTESKTEGKLVVLLGKTCSGKSTQLHCLTKEGHVKVKSVTTRPRRNGERIVSDYDFCSSEEFEDLEMVDSLLAVRHFYSANNEKWSYGIRRSDLLRKISEAKANNKVAISVTDPQGYKDLIEDLGKDKVIGIYLSPDESQRKLRGLVRGDDQKEFNRRIKADEEDFAGLEEKADLIIYEHEVEDITNIIQGFIKEKLFENTKTNITTTTER